jgi:membrane protease YdiL (CAAX protease family)
MKFMDKIKTIYTKRPILGSVLAVLSILLGGAVLHQLITLLLPPLDKEPSAVIMIAMRTIMAVAIIAWLGWWRDVGLTAPRLWRDRKLLLLLVPLPFIPLLDGVDASDANQIVFLGTAALLIAVSEELLYRGILLRALQPYGVVKAVLGLAILFGAVHLPNVFVGGDPGFELLRLAMTVGGAIGLAVIRLRTNMIWGVILAHWGLDFTEYLAVGGIPALGGGHDFSTKAILTMIAYNVFLGAVGLYLLLNKNSRSKFIKQGANNHVEKD